MYSPPKAALPPGSLTMRLFYVTSQWCRVMTPWRASKQPRGPRFLVDLYDVNFAIKCCNKEVTGLAFPSAAIKGKLSPLSWPRPLMQRNTTSGITSSAHSQQPSRWDPAVAFLLAIPAPVDSTKAKMKTALPQGKGPIDKVRNVAHGKVTLCTSRIGQAQELFFKMEGAAQCTAYWYSQNVIAAAFCTN